MNWLMNFCGTGMTGRDNGGPIWICRILAPYCREAKSAGGWEGDSDIMEESFHRNTMEAIDFCVNSLPPEYSLAIGLEMRKRRGAAREWRNGCRGVSYKMAVAAILPKLKAKYLI